MLPVSEDRGQPAGSGEKRILVDRDSSKEQVRSAAGASRKRLCTETSETYLSGDLLQDDQPSLKLEPLFARRQVDFQDSGIRGETKPGPARWKIDRDVSLPINGAPVSDGRGEQPDQLLPLLRQKRREKDGQTFFVCLENQCPLDRVFGED